MPTGSPHAIAMASAGVEHGQKACAVLRKSAFPPRGGTPGCEKFLALLQVRCAGVGECIAVHDHIVVWRSTSDLYMAQSACFKCFFFAVGAKLMAATMRDAVFAGARGGTSAGAGRAPGRGGCENFSRGLLTVKKTVIRFRLSRPCLPNRVSRINRPMRSSPSKTTAILKTVDMAPLPRRNARRPLFRCLLRRSWRASPHP